eukprot:8176160-Pyramimonas_sp.AAC.1
MLQSLVAQFQQLQQALRPTSTQPTLEQQPAQATVPAQKATLLPAAQLGAPRSVEEVHPQGDAWEYPGLQAP